MPLKEEDSLNTEMPGQEEEIPAEETQETVDGLSDMDDAEENDLLSGVLDCGVVDEGNTGTLMAVAIDYAMKRGKIKKNIRKTFKKMIRKHGLEVSSDHPVRVFMVDECKSFLKEVEHEYGEHLEEAMELAFYGGLYIASAIQKDKSVMKKAHGRLYAYLCEKPGIGQIKAEALKLMKDKKDKCGKLLGEYEEKISLTELWDNVDESMKRKLMKAAYLLAVRKAIKG